LGVAQYLKYKDTTKAFLRKKLLWPLAVTAALSLLFAFTIGIHYNFDGPGTKALIYIAMFAAIYAAVANAFYLIDVVKRKVINWGSSLTHFGFAVLLIGILISASNKRTLTADEVDMVGFTKDTQKELAQSKKLKPGGVVRVKDYLISYKSEFKDDHNPNRWHYNVAFTGNNGRSFNLKPSAFTKLKGQDNAMSATPDYRTINGVSDLFIYMTSLTPPDKKGAPAEYFSKEVKINEKAFLSNGIIEIKGVVKGNESKYKFNPKDTALVFNIEFTDTAGRKFNVYPAYVVKNNSALQYVDSVSKPYDIKFRIESVDDKGNIKLGVKNEADAEPFIQVKIIEFPFIKLMWIGTWIMSIGFMIAMVKRIREVNSKKQNVSVK
jgi:cytochrome c-type biogenesis protein CcmF